MQNVSEATSSIVGGVTATAVAVATTVVMFSNIVLATPTFELIDLEEGYNSVSYSIEASELEENVDYYIEISNSKESYQFDIVEGENENIVTDLTHNSVYNLTIFGVNDQSSIKTEYYTIRFFTTSEVQELKTYTVTWMVDDMIYEEDIVEENTIPTYDGEIPVKQPTKDYSYEFKGWDKEISAVTGDITYNAVFMEIIHEFTATYNLIDETTAIIHWDNPDYYMVEMNTDFNNLSDDRLSYRIKLFDEENNQEYIYEGIEKIAVINVPKTVNKVSITYELIGTYNGEEKIFETIELENELIFNQPSIEIQDTLTLIETNKYQASLKVSSNIPDQEIYESINIEFIYNDSSTYNYVIDNVVPNEEIKIDLDVANGISSVMMKYNVSFLGNNGHNQRSIEGSKSFALENEFNLVKTQITNNDPKYAKLYFIYHFIDNGTTIAIRDTLNNEITYLEEEMEYIEVIIDSSITTAEYAYYLSDLSGQALSEETIISLDLTPDIQSLKDSYEFSYQNPGEVLVTYNEDGTINLYFSVTFSTQDSDIYYGIEFINSNEVKEIYYTESYPTYENIPYDNYYIVYRVYKQINGIEYVIEEISVSGGIELLGTLSFEGSVEINENIIEVSFYDTQYVFDETSFILTIDGVDYNIDSSLIVYDQESYTYKIAYEHDTIPTTATVRFQGANYYHHVNYDELSQILNLKGNEFTTIK